jgi:photosynthetic reaction center cytochrome c subunit
MNRRSRMLAVACGALLAPAPIVLCVAADPAPIQKTEDRFKNIQVLKGYPADDLIPTMQFISAALGQDCEFCHVERAPEKDDKKEKQVARKMMTMTLGINRDNFEDHHAVTCNSCHRGAARPVGIPAVATDARSPEEPAPAAAEPPPAEPILDKYLQAAGGAEAFGKITSRIQKGTLTGFGGQSIPVEVYGKAPDKRVSIVHTQHGDSLTGFDGTIGWLGNPGRPPREMSAAESRAARLDADLHFPADVKKLFKDFRPAAPGTIDGKPTLHVVARNEGEPPVDLWFDAQSGLLVRLTRYAETPLGRNPTQIDYADYRDADSVKIPFRWTVARPNGRFTIQVDETRQNEAVDDARFQKPAPPPPETPSKE